jgi:hypothetical protein
VCAPRGGANIWQCNLPLLLLLLFVFGAIFDTAEKVYAMSSATRAQWC